MTHDTPKFVSVVMPMWNAAAHVEEQLAALAEQAYPGPWELVVSDNGSTDDSATIVERWRGRVPGLQIVDGSTRRGSASARNAGVAVARGDLLAFCESDDVVSKGWLGALVDGARAADLVSGTIEFAELNDEASRAWRDMPATPLDALMVFGGFLPIAVGASCAVWRPVLDAVGGWNAEYRTQTDVELSWRVQLASFELQFVPEALVHYRLRDTIRGLARQSYREGTSYVRLYRDFRDRGAPRPPVRSGLRAWGGLVRCLPMLLGSRARRGRFVHQAASRWGRVVGSVRHRTLYL